MCKQASIGEIADVITGKTPPTNKPIFWEADIPFITPKDLQASKHIFATERRVSSAVKDSFSKQIIPAGSVCVSCIGNLGYVGVVETASLSNQQINTVVPNDPDDSDYLYYAMRWLWPYFKHLEGQSTALSIINKSHFEQISIPWPSQATRRIISGILNRFDDLIELNLRTNDYLLELVRVEFDHRFGAETPTTNLGNVMAISTQSLKPSACTGEIWEHYSIPAFDDNRRPVFEPADNIKSNKYAIDNDCILISKLNPSIKRLWLPCCTLKRSVCSTEFIVYKPKRPEHKSFYYAAIDSPSFTDFLLAHVTGSTGSRQRTHPKATLNYPMPNPSVEDIEGFCEFADPIIARWQLNERGSAQLERLRGVLLPKLMSGEIDVSRVNATQLNNHLSAGSMSA
ncbi:MAG TPA: restriction endonuclease subunit S [Candidatus Aphodovivens excrementavium]|nr:restriction endonuclease subunit S [Candidatus Aphodovivens excrementavium]